MMKRTLNPTRGAARSAYTVVELLVVIVIAGILLTIAVPSFQSAIYSSNRSLAVNTVQAATVMGRDVAVNTGKDGAIVFVYDPAVRQIQIFPAIRVGTIRETTTAPTVAGGGGGPSASGFGDFPYFDRDVFVPAPVGEVLTLPESWMVRGYAPPGLLLDYDSAGNPAAVWYNSQMYDGDRVGTNNPNSPKNKANWLFPETGLFARDAHVNGGSLDGRFTTANVDQSLPTARQSFMIRFDGRTGELSRDTRSSLFVNLRNSNKRESGNRADEFEQSLRADLAEDLEVWAQRVLNAPNVTPDDNLGYRASDQELREVLVGNHSNDTILVKPVSRVALYDVRLLALGLGARGVNRATGSFYLPQDQDDRDRPIELDLSLFPGGSPVTSEDEAIRHINWWIDGNTDFSTDGVVSFETDSPESRIFLVQSYTGELKEVLR